MGVKVGAVTIGQAPRVDVVPELRRALGAATIIEQGALDDLSRKEIEAVAPKTKGDRLVTRLRDGTSIRLGKDFLVPRVQECVDRLQERVELILLLCTGTFPTLRSERLVLYPDHILQHFVHASRVQRVGVLTADASQVAFQKKRWEKSCAEVTVEVASPYAPLDGLAVAADRLARADLEMVIMDSIAYTSEMKALVRKRTGRPTVLAVSALGRVAAELLE